MAPPLRAAERALHEGRLDEALSMIRALVDQHPEDPLVWFLLASVLDQQRNWSEAAIAWDDFRARSTTPEAACPAVARAYERAGHLDRAADRYRACLAQDPDNPERPADVKRFTASGRQPTKLRSAVGRSHTDGDPGPVHSVHRAALDPP